MKRTLAYGIVAGLLWTAGLSTAEPEGGPAGDGDRRPPALGREEGARRPGLAEFRKGRGGPGEGERPEGLIHRLLANPKLAAEIGLTENQIASLRLAIDDLRKQEIDLMAQHEKLGLDQARLMTDAKMDEAQIMAAIEKAGQTRTEMAKLKVRQLLLVRKALTPEQMAKVHELMRQQMDRREGGEGKPLRERWEDRKRERTEEGVRRGGPEGGPGPGGREER